MHVGIERQAVAEALQCHDGAGATVLDAPALGHAHKEPEDDLYEDAQHRLQQAGVPGEQEAVAVREAEHPLPHGDGIRQDPMAKMGVVSFILRPPQLGHTPRPLQLSATTMEWSQAGQ